MHSLLTQYVWNVGLNEAGKRRHLMTAQNHHVVSQSAVACIEMPSWRGSIFGREREIEWGTRNGAEFPNEFDPNIILPCTFVLCIAQESERC